MKKITVCLMVLFCLSGHPLNGQEDAQYPVIEANVDGEISEIQLTLPRPHPDFAGELLWHGIFDDHPTRYLRFFIQNTVACEDKVFSLNFINRDGDVIRQYSSREIAQRSPFWTSLIPGDFAKIQMLGTENQPDCKISISQVAYQTEAGRVLSTHGADEKEAIAKYETDPVISQSAKSVAFLHFIRGGKPRVCTGFLVDGNKLMTNEHCINTQNVCDSATVTFGYEYDRDGKLRDFEQYECDTLATTNVDHQLDYAIFTLKGDPQSKWGHLELSARDPSVSSGGGEALFIIQHPAGEPKQISKINCNVMKVPVQGRKALADFTHTCDTVGGSSGSPVIDANGKVVGLHHFGFSAGSIWTENRAVRMKMIAQHIKLQNLTAEQAD